MAAGTNAEQSTNVDDTNVSQTIAKPNVSGSFLILYEINPERVSGSIQKFDGEIMSAEKFNANKDENFKGLKEWALKNGRKIFIIDVSEPLEPLVKIIPEVTVVNNCR